MVNTISRLCVLIGCLFAGIYGLVLHIKKHQRRYFSVALVGVFSIFLSRLFYFILTLSNGNDSDFSVGVFGQISAYLFFSVANRTFLPEHKDKRKFSIAGIIVALPPTAVFIYVAIKVMTLGAILCEVLYIACLCTAVYFAVSVIAERKLNKISASVVPFNLCVCGLVYANAINEVILLFSAEWLSYVALGLAIISGILIAIMLPLLKKGVDKWEA